MLIEANVKKNRIIKYGLAKSRQLPQRKIPYLFQKFYIFPSKTTYISIIFRNFAK